MLDLVTKTHLIDLRKPKSSFKTTIRIERNLLLFRSYRTSSPPTQSCTGGNRSSGSSGNLLPELQTFPFGTSRKRTEGVRKTYCSPHAFAEHLAQSALGRLVCPLLLLGARAGGAGLGTCFDSITVGTAADITCNAFLLSGRVESSGGRLLH